MSEADSQNIALDGRPGEQRASSVYSLRVSSQTYLSLLFSGTFFSALLFYLDRDIPAIVLFAVAWIVLPYLALNDRVAFDGKRLWRTGVLPRWWAIFNGSRRRIKLTDVEQVETEIVRAIKRGNDVSYRYRTTLRSRQVSLSFVSGSDEYRALISSVLDQVPSGALDQRSIELRDHLSDTKETLMRAEFSRIPSSDMLAGVLLSKRSRKLPRPLLNREMDTEPDAAELRSLGGELKVAGYLLQSLEAFRRALVIKPGDPRVLFDFARCLYTIAGLRRDTTLERRARAAVRLAARRGADDGDLLTRVGEWHFQTGDWQRAGEVFQAALDKFGERFLALRGLAELSLREGKFARVVHHFSAAARTAESTSLKRWSSGEAEYFANLNADETYMDMELSRINMAETVETSKRNVLRLALLAMPVIVVGVLFEDELAANLGWAVSSISLVIWIALSAAARLFSRRISYDMIDGQE